MCYQGVMEGKSKFGYLLPDPVLQAFYDVSKRVSHREQWQVLTAAILAYLELTDARQNELIRAVAAENGPGGSFAKLVNEAKEKAGAEPISSPPAVDLSNVEDEAGHIEPHDPAPPPARTRKGRSGSR
jgi:hypothetical protein